MAQHHDNSYKTLFSHPEMVRDLLIEFVDEPWVAQLDFSTLQRVSGSYTTDDLRDREDGIIWKVRWGENWLYVFLIIEFQSRVDKFMAVRLMAYVALLYQDLIRQKDLTPNVKLPPVLPLVLYNGDKRWRAAQDVQALIEPAPGGLERYRPSLRYLLLDELAIADEAEWSNELNSLAAAVFQLEQYHEIDDLLRITRLLNEWLKAPEQASLRRAFVVWLRRVVLPRRLSEAELHEFDGLKELHEVQAMLAERNTKWSERWEQRGIEKGRQEGRQEGVADALRKLLCLKFQELPEWAETRIQAADAAQLGLWLEKVLEADSLETLFKN